MTPHGTIELGQSWFNIGSTLVLVGTKPLRNFVFYWKQWITPSKRYLTSTENSIVGFRRSYDRLITMGFPVWLISTMGFSVRIKRHLWYSNCREISRDLVSCFVWRHQVTEGWLNIFSTVPADGLARSRTTCRHTSSGPNGLEYCASLVTPPLVDGNRWRG